MLIGVGPVGHRHAHTSARKRPIAQYEKITFFFPALGHRPVPDFYSGQTPTKRLSRNKLILPLLILLLPLLLAIGCWCRLLLLVPLLLPMMKLEPAPNWPINALLLDVARCCVVLVFVVLGGRCCCSSCTASALYCPHVRWAGSHFFVST